MPLNYSYIANVPQGNQQVNNTQAPIRDNFDDIYHLVGINHINFNVSDTFGRHNIVSYVEQSIDPDTADNEMALYSKAVTNDPKLAQLFYRYPSNGSVVQLTGLSEKASTTTLNTGTALGGYFLNSTTTPAYGSPVAGWWQYLSNNILLQTFSVSNYITSGDTVPTSPFTVTFPSGTINGVTVPSFTATPFNIQISAGLPQGGTGGTDYMYSVEIVNSTSALVYYDGTFVSGTTTAALFMTVIGV